MTLNGRKIRLSGAKKIKSLLEQIGLGDLWMKAHYGDIGIVNIIRQRLKDIEPVSIKHGLRTTDYGLGTNTIKKKNKSPFFQNFRHWRRVESNLFNPEQSRCRTSPIV